MNVNRETDQDQNTGERSDIYTLRLRRDTSDSSTRFLEPAGQLDGIPLLGSSYLTFLTVTVHQVSHFLKLAMLSCIMCVFKGAHCEFCDRERFWRGFKLRQRGDVTAAQFRTRNRILTQNE